MKLNQFLLFTLCLTFFACSTESTDTPEEENPADNTLLKKIIYNKGTVDEYSETYNYNGNKLISVVGTDGSEEWKNVYTYDDNDNLIKDDYFDADGHIASVVLEYNSENKIATYTETFLESSGLGDRKYKSVFTYNNDGTLTNKVYVSYSNSDFELGWTETITLNGKNIAEIADDEGYKISYGYDDKNGMFKNIHAIEVLNILSENEFGAYIYGNTNNIVSYVESDTSISGNYNDKYEYTYNEKNYPKTCIYTSQYGNGYEDIETIEFFYE
ncbi:hypothetical protein V8G69_09720 [Gaetbulibacter sp. M235]|uniref:hypothetical protein n=1 Tax=Gaetbulibacter sp. M235 TaxID=3126510 RepID=UPI00374FCDF8